MPDSKRSSRKRSEGDMVDDDVSLDNPRVFNPHTGRFEDATEDDADRIAEHEAQVRGEPAPGDRTEDDLRGLEPGFAPPVVTAASPNEPRATDTGTGATGGSGPDV